MELTNEQIKDIAFNTFQPHCDITMIDISEVWEKDGRHYRELNVWEDDPNKINGEITASVEVADHFTEDNVKHLLYAEIDMLGEYLLNQNQ